jgi:hypothetical protein
MAGRKKSGKDGGKDGGGLGKGEYLERLAPLQLELNRMARWLQASGRRLGSSSKVATPLARAV